MACMRLGVRFPSSPQTSGEKSVNLTFLPHYGILKRMQNLSQKGTSPVLVVGIIAVIAVLAGGAFFLLQSKSMLTDQDADDMQTSAPVVSTTPAITNGTYKDGTYKAIGNYVSPGGAESIDVSITLKGNVITEAEVVSKAERSTSKQMQKQFISGYKAQVIGKNINEVNLTKVSGSSLTPRGFNEALDEIKAQAKA